MRATRIGFVLVPLILTCSVRTYSEIAVAAETEAYFSSARHTDHIRATLVGGTCEDALFTLTITSGTSELFFEHTIPMRQLIPCDRAAGNAKKVLLSAIHVVNRAISLRRAYDLDCGPQSSGCWEADVLDRLQVANVPALCFSTNREDSACVAYDPETRSVEYVWRQSI